MLQAQEGRLGDEAALFGAGKTCCGNFDFQDEETVVAGIADRIAVMYAGQIVEQGGVDDVLDRTRHPYTAGLIASLPDASEPGEPLTQIPGTTPDMLNPPQGCAFHPRCARRTETCLTQPALAGEGHLVRCFHPLSGAPSPAQEMAA